MTLNEENTTTGQVLRKLWLNRIFSTIIILLNVFAILSLITYMVFFASNNVVFLKVWSRISFIFRITVFVINAIILIYYYQMAQFFIELIQEDQKKARKFKCAMWFVISIQIITIFMENLCVPLFDFITDYDLLSDMVQFMKDGYIFIGIMNFFRHINPYCIAFFITFIIRYFAFDQIACQN